jgi:hypothetical protein
MNKESGNRVTNEQNRLGPLTHQALERLQDQTPLLLFCSPDHPISRSPDGE